MEKCKRHPAGTYELIYSEDAKGKRKEFFHVTLCLKEHTAYKLHGGNRADFSDGCFLINYNSPQFDKYPEAFQAIEEHICLRPSRNRTKKSDAEKGAVANMWYAHEDENNPARKLRDKVESMEREIKERYKVQTVTKKIIIDESEEKEEL